MLRDLILIGISLFLWGVGEGAFIAFQPLYLQDMGADPLRIGAILGSYGLAATLAHIPAGYLADRWGRRPIMWAGWIFGVLAASIMALANSLPAFVGGMLLYSMTMFVIAPLNSYVAAARGKWSVARVLTLVSVGYNAGAMLGPTLGGALGARYGYRIIFQVAAILFLISTVVIFFIRSQPVAASLTEERGNHLWKNNRFLFFLGAYFLATFSMYLPQPLSPNFLQNQSGLGLEEIGRLYSINSMGIVVLNLIMGQVNAGAGYLIGHIFVAIFTIILWRGSGQMWYAVAFFLMGGFRTARSLAAAHIRSIVSGANMGLAFGIAETTTAIALILAPALAGYLYDIEPVQMYSVSLGAIALSLIISFAAVFQRKAPRETEAPSLEPELVSIKTE